LRRRLGQAIRQTRTTCPGADDQVVDLCGDSRLADWCNNPRRNQWCWCWWIDRLVVCWMLRAIRHLGHFAEGGWCGRIISLQPIASVWRDVARVFPSVEVRVVGESDKCVNHYADFIGNIGYFWEQSLCALYWWAQEIRPEEIALFIQPHQGERRA